MYQTIKSPIPKNNGSQKLEMKNTYEVILSTPVPKQVQAQNTDSQVVVWFPALPFEALDCISCWNLLEGKQQSDLKVGALTGVPKGLTALCRGQCACN